MEILSLPKMSRALIVLISAFLYFFPSQFVFGQTPNIVIIVCDDLNDTIDGIGGHPQAYTPNINRIASSGVTFMNAASNAPVCGPSRASMWSGIHPITSGMYGANQQANRWHNNPILSSKDTLFETFIDQGYYSYATGKIHHNGHESPYSTIMRNTDGTVGFEGQGKYRLSNTYNTLPGSFGPYPNNSSNPVHNGVDPHWWPQAYKDRASPPYSGYGPYQDISTYGGQWTNQTGGANNANFTTWNVGNRTPDEICADQATHFIESYEENKPFLLTIGFARPHSPYYAPAKFFAAPYVPLLNDVLLANINSNDYNDITGPVNSSTKDLAQNSGWYKYTTYRNMGIDAYGDPNRALREFTQAYLACVAFVDEQIGKVLDAIEDSSDPNIRDNTLIILTSDHGYHLGEKQFIFKHTPWEESVRVPFLVTGPGVASNQICNQPISLVDIYPTCIDIAEMTPPHTLDGNSIKPLLENPTNGTWTGNAYSVSGIASKYGYTQNANGYTSTFQSQYNNTKLPYSSAHFSIRTEQFRYIYYRDGEEELYDHIADPNEWTNLVNSGSHSQTLNTMRQYYRYAVGLEEPPPPGPSFILTTPLEGEGFYSKETINIEVTYNNVDFSRVEFYADGNLLKTDSVAPYETIWYDASDGSHQVKAIAIGEQSNMESISNISVGGVNSGVNLISNSGFENGSFSEPLGNFGGVTIGAVTSQSNNGNYSIRVTNRSSNWNGVRCNLDNLGLEIGETYEISFYGRLNTFDETINLNLKVADGNSFNYPNIAQETYTGDWVLVSGWFDYTGNEVHFYVSSSSASADIFVDDIILRKLGGTINPSDTDMDGMLDTLELTYFGDLNQSATSDYDNDGVSNVLEIRSGTNPNDANSYFKVLGNQFNHGLTQDSIAWAGNSGKNYTILGTDDLQGNWEILTEAQSGSLGLDLGVGDGSAYHQWSGMHSDATQKFYRVILDD